MMILFMWIGVYFQFVLILMIGLIGGYAMINGVFKILYTKIVTHSEREFAVNVFGIYTDFGIVMSNLFTILIIKYVYISDLH